MAEQSEKLHFINVFIKLTILPGLPIAPVAPLKPTSPFGKSMEEI